MSIKIKEISFSIIGNNVAEFFYENKPLLEGLPGFVEKPLESKEIFKKTESIYSYEGNDPSFDLKDTLINSFKLKEQDMLKVETANTAKVQKKQLKSNLVFTISKSQYSHGEMIVHLDYKDVVEAGNHTQNYSEVDVELFDSLLLKSDANLSFDDTHINYYFDVNEESVENVIDQLTDIGIVYSSKLNDTLVASGVIMKYNIVIDSSEDAVDKQDANQAFNQPTSSNQNNQSNSGSGLLSSLLGMGGSQSSQDDDEDDEDDEDERAAIENGIEVSTETVEDHFTPKDTEVPEDFSEDDIEVKKVSYDNVNDFIIEMCKNFDEKAVQNVVTEGKLDLNECYNSNRMLKLSKEGSIKMSKGLEFLCKLKQFV